MDKVQDSPMIHNQMRLTTLVTGCCQICLNLGLSFNSCSTVCKPRSPRTTDPPPAFSSSSLLGGGLSELDHLLQELNATQFNITGLYVCICICSMLNCELFLLLYLTMYLSSDEILAQFPSKKDEKDKIKDKTTTSSR